MNWYVGNEIGTRRKVVVKASTEEPHDHRFSFFVGPFKTKKEAIAYSLRAFNVETEEERDRIIAE